MIEKHNVVGDLSPKGSSPSSPAPLDPIMDYLRKFMKDKVETEEDKNAIDKVFEQLGDT